MSYNYFEVISAERFREIERLKARLNTLNNENYSLKGALTISEIALNRYTVNPDFWPSIMRDNPSTVAIDALLMIRNIMDKTVESVECKNASDATNKNL